MLPRGAPGGGPFFSVIDLATPGLSPSTAASSLAAVYVGQLNPSAQLSELVLTSALAKATQQEFMYFATLRSPSFTRGSPELENFQLSNTYTISAECGAPCGCAGLRHSGT